MNKIETIARKLFGDNPPCRCGGGHQICLGCAVCRAGGSHCPWPADLSSDLAVAASFPVGDRSHRRPDRLLEWSAPQVEGRAQLGELAGSIFVQLGDRLLDDRVRGSCPGFDDARIAPQPAMYPAIPCVRPGRPELEAQEPGRPGQKLARAKPRLPDRIAQKQIAHQ
mgnify:CR=1 FL=1